MTKKETYNYLLTLINTTVTDTDLKTELDTFLNKEIAALDKKAMNAKKYATKKEDTMIDAIKNVLTNDWMTISEITDLVGGDATTSKVAYRLSKMAKSNLVSKDSINVSPEGAKKRVVTVYKSI